MGWKSGAAAGAAAGAFGGPIGAAIGAGIGGFLGSLCENEPGNITNQEDEIPSIYLAEEGLYFPKSNWKIDWNDIAEVKLDGDDGDDTFEMTGGVVINCPSNLVVYDSSDEEGRERINEKISSRDSRSIADKFDDFDEESDKEDIISVACECATSIAMSKETLERLRSDSNLVVDFNYCLTVFESFVRCLGIFSDQVREWCESNYADLYGLVRYFSHEVAVDDAYSQDEDLVKGKAAQAALCLLKLREELSSSHDFDRVDYALYHTAFDEIGDLEFGSADEAVDWLALQFMRKEYDNDRKVIVCTEEIRKADECEVEIPGVAILRAETIIAAIKRVDDLEYGEVFEAIRYAEDHGIEVNRDDLDANVQESLKGAYRENFENRLKRNFKFEMGHPRNGVTYVQHPIEKNRYIDINTFNTTLLERKYDELIRILLALGASSITCAVSNDSSSGQKVRGKRNVGGEGHSVFGSGDGSYERNSFSDRTSALYKKLSCKIERSPNQQPYLPKDTVFFQFEDRWQQMAQDVLSGQRKREEVDLSYRKEYSLSCNETRSISAKLESLIPGFQFGGSANYSDEYEAELKELESVTWHYEIEFGGVADVAETPKEETPIAKPACGDKAEAMILGRAKRYAKTEEATKSGMLTDAQRADLEKLAAKYGIDEFRLEELIDEAFA